MNLADLTAGLTSEELDEFLTIAEDLERKTLHRCLIETVPQFSDGWFYRDLCTRLERFAADVLAGESPRLILNVPPRHLKSETSSVRFPLWFMSQNPNSEIIVASYGQRLSEKFSRRARALAEHPYFKGNFKTAVQDGHGGSQYWSLKNGASYFATSVGGSATGSGASVLVIDDPVKDYKTATSQAFRETQEDWFEQVATTRLTPGGGILIVATRWVPDDLCGWLMDKIKTDPDADRWDLVCYPAIAENDETHRRQGEALHPARFDLAKLAKLQKAMSSGAFSALYQQNPIVEGGNMFKEMWFRKWDKLPKRFDEIIQSWDLRFSRNHDSGDWVVGQVWGRHGRDAYLLDQARGRWGFVETVAEFLKMTKKWPTAHRKLVEKKANGEALEDSLRDKVLGIMFVEPLGTKVQRASSILHWPEQRRVFFPEWVWTGDFMMEMTSFPACAHDDRVDSMTQALQYFEKACGQTSAWEALSRM